MATASNSGRAPVLSGENARPSTVPQTVPQAVDLLVGRLAAIDAKIVSSSVSSERACVEWRFGDGDPETLAIRSIFIRRAEAEAIVQEGEVRIFAAYGCC
ncbi:hypothetical protein ASF65_20480 [Aureimonas sp. Leaf324]|nr:hypothetical protein ASF65_20480 [Aureimonas sp. Leaf324]